MEDNALGVGSLVGNGVIGIRREDKNNWERRVPLTPSHVAQLVQQHGLKVLIQPSNIRVFPNQAYEEAGATVQEDLSGASTILAVKEVPLSLLIPERTYAFFSHTIKAQPSNMPLLDALLHHRIRMIDYECITAGAARGGRRLVAFGRYAGIAGMVDFLRGMGERFLALGYSTPFLSVAAMYTYPDVGAALAAVAVCGQAIQRYGLPSDVCPLTIVVTGDGNVSRGAQEVLQQLGCVKWVSPFQLEGVVQTATGRDRSHVVYVAVAKEEHMVRRRTAASTREAEAVGAKDEPLSMDHPHPSSSSPLASSPGGESRSPRSVAGFGASVAFDAAFDKAAYKTDPDAFEPIFHAKVAPFASVIVNCMYWEPRFPRLLTVAQARSLQRAGRLRLLGVCDITCDFKGSIEFLNQFTSIESPFYIYDAEADASGKDMNAPGILFHAVDHLPSECPKDASEHFGECLLAFLPALAISNGALPFAEQTDLPVEIRGAVICDHGALTPNFDYISTLRRAATRAEAVRGLRASRHESFITLDLVGHLFDSGIINRVLDMIEDQQASARILDFKVGKDRSTPTEMRIQVFARNSSSGAGGSGAALAALLDEIRAIAVSVGVALTIDAEGSYLHETVAHVPAPLPKPALAPHKSVLVLGAGFVAGPMVDILLRRPATSLTVASMIPGEAQAFTRARASLAITPITLDVLKEDSRLGALVEAHDIVVALIPGFALVAVARWAIAHKRHMVTASYVDAAMRALSPAATAAGITILGEAGLDPGIDHMSARRMIDAVHDRGGWVTGFSSVCGGLPAPEAANNPLGYKFSWSPRGAIAAALNTARYLRDGATVEVRGDTLLSHAAPFRVNPAFALEVLPNRDAFPYADLYGISGPRLRSMFRGTLRYAGFSRLMSALVALGFLGMSPEVVPVGATLRQLLLAAAGVQEETASDGALFAAVWAKVTSSGVTHPGDSKTHADELRSFLAWLGLFSSAPAPLTLSQTASVATPAVSINGPGPATTTHVPLDTLVSLLVAKPEMSFAPGERDLALMQHDLRAAFPDGHEEEHVSTLIEYANAKGQTAMARTVGYTAGLAAAMLLDGAAVSPGVHSPITKEWYAPLLERLEAEGIRMAETVRVVVD